MSKARQRSIERRHVRIKTMFDEDAAGDPYGRIYVGTALPQRKPPARKPATQQQEKEMPKERTPRSELEQHIAALDAQRAAELQQRRDERRNWNLDALPASLSRKQKLDYRISNLAITHAARMVHEGRLDLAEFNRFRGAVVDDAARDLPRFGNWRADCQR